MVCLEQQEGPRDQMQGAGGERGSWLSKSKGSYGRVPGACHHFTSTQQELTSQDLCSASLGKARKLGSSRAAQELRLGKSHAPVREGL